MYAINSVCLLYLSLCLTQISSFSLATSQSTFLPIALPAALAHSIVTFLIQDLTDLTDPNISLSGSYVAQIIWDGFESRYGYGLPSLLLMLVPLGAIFFCGMLSITSASRCLQV